MTGWLTKELFEELIIKMIIYFFYDNLAMYQKIFRRKIWKQWRWVSIKLSVREGKNLDLSYTRYSWGMRPGVWWVSRRMAVSRGTEVLGVLLVAVKARRSRRRKAWKNSMRTSPILRGDKFIMPRLWLSGQSASGYSAIRPSIT